MLTHAHLKSSNTLLGFLNESWYPWLSFQSTIDELMIILCIEEAFSHETMSWSSRYNKQFIVR